MSFLILKVIIQDDEYDITGEKNVTSLDVHAENVCLE